MKSSSVKVCRNLGFKPHKPECTAELAVKILELSHLKARSADVRRNLGERGECLTLSKQCHVTNDKRTAQLAQKMGA